MSLSLPKSLQAKWRVLSKTFSYCYPLNKVDNSR
ncbi:hypothetical protein BB2000_0722 [Proteus mirabilis BB2000]|nr:hypothetical protein BB2000_0722 [Proteus mirabilis BB2000]